MTSKATFRRKARDVFLKEHPIGPWPCHFCGGPITQWGKKRSDGHIHHVDEDYTNNDPENLVAGHCSCHYSYHASRQQQSEQTKAKRSSTLKDHPVSDETRRKISEANKGGTGDTGFTGGTHSEESRAKMRAAAARRRERQNS